MKASKAVYSHNSSKLVHVVLTSHGISLSYFMFNRHFRGELALPNVRSWLSTPQCSALVGGFLDINVATSGVPTANTYDYGNICGIPANKIKHTHIVSAKNIQQG